MDGSSTTAAPPHLRSATPHGRTWWATLGAERVGISRDAYCALVLRAEVTNNVEIRTIEKDVHRTFADRPEFRWLEARLRRVLRSYALRNTYCQGMSFIAAMLLQHLPEESAFCCLAIIVEDFLPPGYFTEELQGVYMDQHIAFDVFLPHRLPRLAAHFKALEVPTTLIGVRWFLCLFCADIEPSATAQLWDVLFSHGSHMLFAIALDLLAAAEDALLAAADVAELFVLLRNLSRHKTSWTRLFEQAAAFPSEADVAVARARYRLEKEATDGAEHLLPIGEQDPDTGGHSELDVRARGFSAEEEHGTAPPMCSRPARIGPYVGRDAPNRSGTISLEAARSQARHAAALLLYERGAAAAAIVQAAELNLLCGGEAGRQVLVAEMLPRVAEVEPREQGFWLAAAPAFELAGNVVGRIAVWLRSASNATGGKVTGTLQDDVGLQSADATVHAVTSAPVGGKELSEVSI